MSGPFTDVPIVKNRFSAIDDQVFIDRGKRISEYRGCFFKGHAVSAKICSCLARIPFKSNHGVTA